MAEYIDREALRKVLENWRDAHADVDDEQGCGLPEDVIWEVDAQPAADVAPVVHGKWIVRFDGPYKRRRCYCSHCGKHNGVGGIAQNQEKPYCPNCGAKMDGGDSDMGVCLKIYSDGNVHTEAWQSRKPEDFCSYGEQKDGADAEG